MTPRGRGSVRGFVRAVFPYSLAPHGSESVRVVCLARGSRTGWFPYGSAPHNSDSVRFVSRAEVVLLVRAGFPYGLALHRSDSVRIVSRTQIVPHGVDSRTAWRRTETIPYGLRLSRTGGFPHGLAPRRRDSVRVVSRTGACTGWIPARHGALRDDSVRVVSRTDWIPCRLSLAIFVFLAGARWPCAKVSRWPANGRRGLALGTRKVCHGPSKGLQKGHWKAHKKPVEGPRNVPSEPARRIRKTFAPVLQNCRCAAQTRPICQSFGALLSKRLFFRKSAMQNALSAFQRLSWLLCAVINSELIRSGRVEMH